MTTTLAQNIALNDQRLRVIQHPKPESENGVALYIHIPFCHHRCSYCDFNIYAGMRSLYQPYAEAIAQEIAAMASRAGRVPVPSIYIGGGTPSLFPVELIGGLLATVRAFFEVNADAEITLEANPGSGQSSVVSRQYFEQLRALGVNRVSLGVQSSHAHELHLLRRGHSFQDAVAAFQAMRQAGLDNLNIDLIYGLPRQSIDEWRETLERAIDLRPEHISAYSLQVEEQTAMYNWVRDRRVPSPDNDVVAEMYELTETLLAEAGFGHYEISNWARGRQKARGGVERLGAGEAERRKEDFRSRHNLVYWRNEPYLGLGCGAHSSYAGRRFSNVTHPREYIRRIQDDADAVAEVETIEPALEMGETLMLGLRLIEEGVERVRFKDRFGLELAEVYGPIMVRLIDQGLLESTGDGLRLTQRGRLLGNRVFAEFLPDGKHNEI